MYAAGYVETAVAVHRSYLDGKLAPEIQSGSPAFVTAWFAGKVPFDFRLPADRGGNPLYRLSGARLVSYGGQNAALVIYDTQTEKISLLVASEKSATIAGGDEVRSGNLVFHYFSRERFKVITWSNHCHQNMADRNAFRTRQ